MRTYRNQILPSPSKGSLDASDPRSLVYFMSKLPSEVRRSFSSQEGKEGDNLDLPLEVDGVRHLVRVYVNVYILSDEKVLSAYVVDDLALACRNKADFKCDLVEKVDTLLKEGLVEVDDDTPIKYLVDCGSLNMTPDNYKSLLRQYRKRKALLKQSGLGREVMYPIEQQMFKYFETTITNNIKRMIAVEAAKYDLAILKLQYLLMGEGENLLNTADSPLDRVLETGSLNSRQLLAYSNLLWVLKFAALRGGVDDQLLDINAWNKYFACLHFGDASIAKVFEVLDKVKAEVDLLSRDPETVAILDKMHKSVPLAPILFDRRAAM